MVLDRKLIMVRKKKTRKKLRKKRKRIQVYLDEEDIEYLQALMGLTNIKSMSEAMRLVFKSFRIIFPYARYFVQTVMKIMEEEKKKSQRYF